MVKEYFTFEGRENVFEVQTELPTPILVPLDFKLTHPSTGEDKDFDRNDGVVTHS